MIYTVGIGTLKSQFGFASPWSMLGLIAISAVLLLFVLRNGLAEKYGLSFWTKNSKAMLWLILSVAYSIYLAKRVETPAVSRIGVQKERAAAPKN